MPAEISVEQPKHPLPQMTTFELRDYRRDLEKAIARLGTQDPVSPAPRGLQVRLDAVIAEQESRAKLTADGRSRSGATTAVPSGVRSRARLTAADHGHT